MRLKHEVRFGREPFRVFEGEPQASSPAATRYLPEQLILGHGRNVFAIQFVSMVLYKQTAALRNLEKVVAKFESGFNFTMKIELV